MQELVLAQTVVQRRAVDAEEASGGGNAAFTLLQGRQDLVCALARPGDRLEVRPLAPSGSASAAGVMAGDAAALVGATPAWLPLNSRSQMRSAGPPTKIRGALDQVFKLADVAGKAVARQQILRRWLDRHRARRCTAATSAKMRHRSGTSSMRSRSSGKRMGRR